MKKGIEFGCIYWTSVGIDGCKLPDDHELGRVVEWEPGMVRCGHRLSTSVNGTDIELWRMVEICGFKA
jgi:hypothetical protein